MKRSEIEEKMSEIIKKVEGNSRYHYVELKLKEALENFRIRDDFNALTSVAEQHFGDLMLLGVDAKTLVLFARPSMLVTFLEEFYDRGIEIEPVIATVVAEIGEKNYHDIILDGMKKRKFKLRYTYFPFYKDYLSSSEIAEFLFEYCEDHNESEIKDEIVRYKDNLEKIAIKEGYAGMFLLNFVFPIDGGKSIKDLFSYCVTLRKRGAGKRDLLLGILFRLDYKILFYKDELEQLGFHLSLIADEILYALKCDNVLIGMITFKPKALMDYVDSLSHKKRKDIFNALSSEEFEHWFYSCSVGQKTRRRAEKFYLENVPVLEGELPITCLEDIPIKDLLPDRRIREYKRYLKRVENGEDMLIEEQFREGCAETAKELLKKLG